MKVDIHTDGACRGNPGQGGWAAILKDSNGTKRVLSGQDERTTNNRMEVLAAIKGLEATPQGSDVTIHSDSQYLIRTMTGDWQRNANMDLWEQLDQLCASREVDWEWVKAHAGNSENEEANAWAGWEAGVLPEPPPASEDHLDTEGPATGGLTHLDEQGRASMVDVGWKPDTAREAVARGFVTMRPHILQLIKDGELEKGDVLSTAKLAGIMGAKRTAQLIPLCHPIPLDHVSVDLEVDDVWEGIHITATAKSVARTGVEMEALTAVSVAALTIYDMCKSLDRGIRIQEIRLVKKRGGKSGDIVLEE